MKYLKIDLYKEYGMTRKDKKTTGYLEEIGGNGTTSVIVLPGGGYSFLSPLEKYNVAEKFISLGYKAYVLEYSVAPIKFPHSLFEVFAAVDYVKEKAKTKVAVLGFSAGGHLAGSSATLHDKPFAFDAIREKLGEIPEGFSPRPDFAILCYPVISSKKEIAHKGSFKNLCGRLNFALKEKLSLETQIDSETSPCFLWHTEADRCVPCQNSVVFSETLKKAGVKTELVLYPRGGHGLSLGNAFFPEVKDWPNRCDEFIRGI